MPSSARDNYVNTEVRTAPPQKLQLMLVEEALRSAERTGRQWQAGQNAEALESILHAQAVLGQLLAAIDRQSGGDLAERVSAVYEFVFRRLVQAGRRRDEKCLADAVRVLRIERDTWRQLCDKLTAETEPEYRVDARSPVAAPIPLPASQFDDLPAGGFSIEA